MVVVKLLDKPPSEIIELVHQLKATGLIQGTDFDFAFHQSKWDDMIGEIPRHARFIFYNEKAATLFALRWS